MIDSNHWNTFAVHYEIWHVVTFCFIAAFENLERSGLKKQDKKNNQ